MAKRDRIGMVAERPTRGARKRVADVLATAAMGSWIVLAVMPVVVVIVALT